MSFLDRKEEDVEKTKRGLKSNVRAKTEAEFAASP